MFTQGLNLLQSGRRRPWSAAIVSAALAWSGTTVSAQSMLRFVGPNDEPAAPTISLPQPTIAAVPAATPSASEYRFVELTEGKVTPLPQFSVSSRNVSAAGQSTLNFAPTAPAAPQPLAQGGASTVESYDLRFKSEAQVQQEGALSPASVAAAPAVEAIAPAPARGIDVRPAPAPWQQNSAYSQSPSQQLATELFAAPSISSNAIQPRIAMVLEHVPAPAPQHAGAQPVRTDRSFAPTYTSPAGTELFASGASSLIDAAPAESGAAAKHWNLPAMDYGAALRQVQPELPAVTRAKPIEPRRVVAHELPQSAAEMFGVGAPEPMLKHPTQQGPGQIAAASPPVPKQMTLQSTSVPAPSSASIVHPSVVQQPVVGPSRQTIVASKPVAAPVVAAANPPAATREHVERPVSKPVADPTPTSQVATAIASLPLASELQFDRVSHAAEPGRPQFVAASPTQFASSAPAATTTAQQQLVPAKVDATSQITTSQSKLPFDYEPGELAKESHVAEYKPAPVAAAVAPAPERGQVIATVDPQDPNTYTLSLATASSPPAARYVSRMEPVAQGEVGPEALPNALHVPGNCNTGACGPYGCPYLPGQSGTRALCGVDCGGRGSSCCSTWSDATCIPWALLGPGEYVGPARPAHVETYYLRVNDLITLTFIESRKKSAEHYRIGIGDELQIEWLQGGGNTERALDRNLLVQPDGTVTLPLIGEVTAAGKTVNDFRDEVVRLYSKFQRDPQITVTPLTVNVAVQDILRAVTSKNASSGQTQDVRVTPEGTIQAAGVGSVYVQGLTLDELRSELEARYAEFFGPGLAVSPQLTERATSYVFMGGEVRTPGRYVLEGPTTVMQAVALAGGWNNGGNMRQVVIFRRDENWCLKATKIDIRGPYYGKDPCPTNDVWLRDNDLVIVPKSCILCATDMINLYFTRGIYAVFPVTYVYDLSQNTGIVPVP